MLALEAKKMYKIIFKILLIISFSAVLSGCPPVVYFEICNNSHEIISIHDGSIKQVQPNKIGSFMIPPSYFVKGTEVQLTVNGQEMNYFVKIEDKQFYKQRPFSGLIRAQLNPDRILYIVQSNSSCPELNLPVQSGSFPIQGITINASNK